MSSCLEYQEKMSAFCDGQLPDQEWLEVETHLSKCSVCFEENAKMQLDLSVLNHLGKRVPEIKIPQDFSQNVMARVRVSQVKTNASANGILKRACVFAAVFVVYSIYALSAAKNGNNELQIALSREMVIFNILIAGMGLGFVFFSNELVGLNNKVLKRFSEQYDRIRQSDVFVSRLIGLSIFFGLLTHKLIFSAMSHLGLVF